MTVDREALADWVDSLSKDSLSMLAYFVRPSLEAEAFPILLNWIDNDVEKQSGAIKLVGYVEGISEEEEQIRFDTLLSLVENVYESINIRLNAMSGLLALDTSDDMGLTIAQTFVHLLEDDNDDIRKFAANQLKWFAHPTLEADILAQYNAQPRLQEALIPAIAKIGTVSAINKLWEIMQTHAPNSLLYKNALEALVSKGDRRVTNMIVPTILANDYPYIERSMKEIDEPYTELLPDMMAALHERLKNAISSVRERDPLMLAIVYTAREDAVQYMQPLLDSDNPKLPRLALAALYEGKQQAYVESLVPYLQHESPIIVMRTIEVIGGYNESIPHLVPLLDHENHGVVGKTVSTLSWSRNREALAHLLPLLTHSDSRLVDYVCRALKRIPDDILKTGFYDFLNTLSATEEADLRKMLNEISHGNDLRTMWDELDNHEGETET